MKLIEMKINFLNYIRAFRKEGTFKHYNDHINIIDWLIANGYNEDYEVDSKILTKFIIESKNRLSNRTINMKLNSLKQCYKINNLCNQYITNLKKLTEFKKSYSRLYPEELDILLSYLPKAKMSFKSKVIIKLLCETGIRCNELLNLKIEHLNFSRSEMNILESKNNQQRVIPLTPALLDDLKKLIRERKKGFVFNLKEYGLQSIFRRLDDKFNFKVRAHILRHTFACRCIEGGMDLRTLQYFMGHSKLSTTEIYLNLTYMHKRSQYEKVFCSI